MGQKTQKRIVEAFVDMVTKDSLAHVRIATIISKLGINRNTFYYYFSSKYEVAMWVFRTDLGRMLHDVFPEEVLMYAPIDSKILEGVRYPYYVHIEIGARTLDCEQYFKLLVHCVLKRRTFYRKLFNKREIEFAQSIANLYRPALLNDIAFILDGRYLAQETQNLLATLGSQCIVFALEFFLEQKSLTNLIDNRINPFWNILHESLYVAIQSHPVNRYVTRPLLP